MLPQELISKVKKIEIRTRRIVDEITGGAYHSVFKGRGIEFDEVREYAPEDDVRDIDWNVTARMGSPYIKKYVEERELTVILAVDASASGAFGSGDKSKKEMMIEAASLLAFSAIRNNDKVGLLIFTDNTELYLPPRSGRSHGLRLIRDLLAFEPSGRKTDINVALESLVKVLNKRSVIFLLSDLIDDNGFEKSLKLVNKRHDLIAVRVLDPLELKWPSLAGVLLEDAETASRSFVSGRGSRFVDSYFKEAALMHDSARDICRRSKVDMIDIRTDDDIIRPLIEFFNRRRKR